MDEKRRAPRVDWAGQIVLSTLAGEPRARGIVGNLSDGGILVVQVPTAERGRLAVGDRLRFEFNVPSGAVQGSVEVVRAAGDELGLRMLTITNDGGLHNLLGFLHRWLGGAAG